ncbi:hypothetical protein QE152_g38944 [Popillia japonica]|uniref:Uncharacterized protein n=1 Tax=Popillia japonica TaxID=7064 RepID=A0AAW1HV73_POPJA
MSELEKFKDLTLEEMGEAAEKVSKKGAKTRLILLSGGILILTQINNKDYQLVMNGKVFNIRTIDNVQFKNETVKIRGVHKQG